MGGGAKEPRGSKDVLGRVPDPAPPAKVGRRRNSGPREEASAASLMASHTVIYMQLHAREVTIAQAKGHAPASSGRGSPAVPDRQSCNHRSRRMASNRAPPVLLLPPLGDSDPGDAAAARAPAGARGLRTLTASL